MKELKRPLKEHFETETDIGASLATFNYIQELEQYADKLEKEWDEVKETNEQIFENINNKKQFQEIQYEQMNTKIGQLEKELQTLKDKVKAFIKADDDYVMNKIDTDTYDNAFNKLKQLTS